MAAPNKAQFLADVQTILKKRFKPGPAAPRMTVLEAVVFAICRENSTREQANQVLSRFKDGFFDWNEIRVSSIAEIEETLAGLSDTEERAFKIRRFLRQLFQKTYGFSLEALQKKPLKEALKTLSNYEAFASDYIEASVVLLALGGHAIPVDKTTRRVLGRLGMVDPKDDDKMLRAHLERAVPKNRAVEFIDLIEDLGFDTCVEAIPQCDRCDLRKICPKQDPPPLPLVEVKPKAEAESAVEAKSHSTKGSKSATAKNGEAKSSSKSKSAPKAETKAAEPKSADTKHSHEPTAETKTAEPRRSETKSAEPKHSQSKTAEPKNSQSKTAEAKHPESKRGGADKQTESKHIESKHIESKQAEPRRPEAKHAESTHPEAKHAESTHPEAKHAETTHSEAKHADVKRIEKQSALTDPSPSIEDKHEKRVAKTAEKDESKHAAHDEKPSGAKDSKAGRLDSQTATKSETKTHPKSSEKAERPAKTDDKHPATAQGSHSSDHKTKTENK